MSFDFPSGVFFFIKKEKSPNEVMGLISDVLRDEIANVKNNSLSQETILKNFDIECSYFKMEPAKDDNDEPHLGMTLQLPVSEVWLGNYHFTSKTPTGIDIYVSSLKRMEQLGIVSSELGSFDNVIQCVQVILDSDLIEDDESWKLNPIAPMVSIELSSLICIRLIKEFDPVIGFTSITASWMGSDLERVLLSLIFLKEDNVRQALPAIINMMFYLPANLLEKARIDPQVFPDTMWKINVNHKGLFSVCRPEYWFTPGFDLSYEIIKEEIRSGNPVKVEKMRKRLARVKPRKKADKPKKIRLKTQPHKNIVVLPTFEDVLNFISSHELVAICMIDPALEAYNERVSRGNYQDFNDMVSRSNYQDFNDMAAEDWKSLKFGLTHNIHMNELCKIIGHDKHPLVMEKDKMLGGGHYHGGTKIWIIRKGKLLSEWGSIR